MGFRFRKSVRLGKGVRINLGKRGASLSLGGRGATVNLSGRGVRSTVGIPGTGISYTTSNGADGGRSTGGSGGIAVFLLAVVALVFLAWIL